MRWFLLFLLLQTSLFSANITHFIYEGAINPAANTFVTQALEKAQQKNSQLIIFELNTPGGLSSSTRDIVTQILNSKIPFVVYVSPKGAQAASAGTYILYSAHLSAMAPGTNVGAATPVKMGALQENKDSTLSTKVTQDAAAYIQSLAKMRDKNVTWAKQSVLKGESVDAQKALQINVTDMIAQDINLLLKQIHGKKIKIDEKTITLDTKDATIDRVEPSFKIQLLSYLSNPNIAYVLMLLAVYGIFFELMNPGSIFPGVIGLISGGLALYALNILPFDYAGLLLILIGISLMVSEVFVAGFGILGMGGVVAFVFGSLILFDEKTLGVDISLSLIVAFALVSAAFFIYLVKVIISERKQKAVTGIEEMIGMSAKVIKKTSSGYKVALHSEIWNAVSKDELKKDDEVVVQAVEGLTLHIKSKE